MTQATLFDPQLAQMHCNLSK